MAKRNRLDPFVEITIEVKACPEIDKVVAEKYANKYVQAFVGSYKKISPTGRTKLKEAGVLEHGHLSMEKVWETLKLHADEVEAARKLIAAHRDRQKQQRTSK